MGVRVASLSIRFWLEEVVSRKFGLDGVVEWEEEARRRAVVADHGEGRGKRSFVGVVGARSRASKR